MILNTGKKQYKIVRDVLSSEVNDVFICQDVDNKIADYKTLWVIKDRTVAKKVLAELDTGNQNQICFMMKDNMCFTFPYTQERPLDKFYVSTVQSETVSSEQIWLDLVVQCMTCMIPEVLLQMIFLQNQIQLSQDGSIHINYFLDLSKYDEYRAQPSSIVLCAKTITNLIFLEQGTSDVASRLIDRKLQRKEYTQYIELYKDIKILMEQQEKKDFRKNIYSWYDGKKDMIFHVISRVSILLLFIVISMLIMKLFLGDVPLFRLFSGPIKQIGTESLLQ